MTASTGIVTRPKRSIPRQLARDDHNQRLVHPPPPFAGLGQRELRLDDDGGYEAHGLRETGFWRFVTDSADPTESQSIELLLAHSSGYVELFYGRPLTQSSWELVTDALARSKSGVLVGGAKRLYGIVDGGDLGYVEERVDADGGLVPHLSARLSRFVG